jgi:prefoldin subunit 5
MAVSDDERKIRELEEQARTLQQLIDEARRLQREIDRHLQTVRRASLPHRGPDRRRTPR